MSAVLMAAALDDVSAAKVLCCSAEVIPVTQEESMACMSNAEWAREQRKDPVLHQVIDLLEGGDVV